MSNEIAIQNTQLPAHLQNAQGAATDEFSAGIQSGPALPFLSVRGKEFRFRWQGQERSTRARELEVVLIAARPNVSKRWYADAYTSGSVEAPDCASTDGIRPDAGVKSPQHANCSACPRNQFGSKITATGKQGKECSDYKRMVVWPIIDGEPLDTPVIIDVPATSLKATKGHRGDDLFLREYFALLGKHHIPPNGVVTKLQFTDAEYPQLCFGLSRYTTEQEFSQAQQWRENDDVKEALRAAEAEAPGPITQNDSLPIGQPPSHVASAAEQPAEAPPPAPASAPEAPAAAPPAEPPPPPPAAEPEPDPQPEKAAEPASAPAAEEGDGDPMADVRILLGGMS